MDQVSSPLLSPFSHPLTPPEGSITTNELVSIMGSEEHAREIVGEIDLNGDGVVSYEEFKAMMQGLNNHSARYRALMGESEHPDSELAQEAGMISPLSQGSLLILCRC